MKLSATIDAIYSKLQAKECAVIKNGCFKDNPGNSEVFAVATPIPMNFLSLCVDHFRFLHGKERTIHLADIKLGLNVVRIEGDEISKEGLHVHLSHIIALVFEGEGVLEWNNNIGERFSSHAMVNDIVVIPRGVLHYFTGSLSFAALEFGDVIDYQKHHFSAIERDFPD